MPKARADNSAAGQTLERLDVLERENRELTARLVEITAAAARNDDGITLELKESLERFADFRFVVNDENSACTGQGVFRWCVSACDGCWFRHQ